MGRSSGAVSRQQIGTSFRKSTQLRLHETIGTSASDGRAALLPRIQSTESRLRGCLFHIAVLAGLLEPRLNRRSAIFGNFVPSVP